MTIPANAYRAIAAALPVPLGLGLLHRCINDEMSVQATFLCLVAMGAVIAFGAALARMVEEQRLAAPVIYRRRVRISDAYPAAAAGARSGSAP